MGDQTMKSDRWKLGLSLFWFLFTFSLTTWWWIFSFRQLDLLSDVLGDEKYHSMRRMLLGEGLVLLVAIFCGGLTLVILINRERARNDRLRLFFSNFTHDLKTSLSRLRVRAEMLETDQQDPRLEKLLSEVSRLDLQLENSLWVARGDSQRMLQQKVSLSSLVGALRVEWPELQIQLNRDAEVIGDEQALRSVFRNLFQNSWLHGQATRLDIKPEKKGSHWQILITDDGKGFAGNRKELGKQLAQSQNVKGNGLGLYLTKDLIERMNGRLTFPEVSQGFQAEIHLPAVNS